MQIIKLSHVGDAEPVKSTCSLQFINPNKPNFKEILENIDIPIILTYHEIAQTDASEIGGNYQLKLTNCKCDKDVQLVPFPSTFNYASKNIVADTVMITDFTFHFLPRKSSNYLEMIVHSNGSTLAYTNAVTFSYYTTIIFALMVIVLAQLLFRMIGYTHIALFDMQRIGCSEENLERIPSSALVSCITDAPQWIHTDTDINTELHVIEDHIEGLHSSAENQPSMYDFKSLTDDAINIDDDNSDEMLLVNVTSTNIMLKATIASITSFPGNQSTTCSADIH